MGTFATDITDFAAGFSLFELAIRATIALATAALVCLLLRRRSAAIRHRIWLLGLAASVVVPIAALMLPGIPLPVFAASMPQATPPSSTPVDSVTTRTDNVLPMPATNKERTLPADSQATAAPSFVHETGSAGTNNATSGAPAPQDSWALEQILSLFWLLGCAIGMCVFLIAGLWQWLQVSRMQTLRDTDWQQAVDSAASRLKLTRHVTTRVSNGQQIPAVFGLFRATLIVPADWQRWSVEQRECILLHELAHIQRRDVATQVFARLAVLAQWFNPLAWYAGRQLRVERELASDDCVLRTGCSASNYAQQLLLTVKQHRPMPTPLAVAMAHSARLDDRVQAILDPQKNRDAPGLRSFAVAIALTMFGCVAIGATTPTTTSAVVPIAALPSDPTPRRPGNAAPAMAAPQAEASQTGEPMIDDSNYREGYFGYGGKFYPLAADGNQFEVSIKTTFGLQRTLIVSAEADRDHLKQHFDFNRMNGFVAFDVRVPFDYSQLANQSYDGTLTDDDDVSVYTEIHEFAEQQSLEILDRSDEGYLMKAGWILEGGRVATAFGRFRFSKVTVYTNDKTFGARRRKLIEDHGENIPADELKQLDSDMCESAWKELESIAPKARSQYTLTGTDKGNIVRFSPKD